MKNILKNKIRFKIKISKIKLIYQKLLLFLSNKRLTNKQRKFWFIFCLILIATQAVIFRFWVLAIRKQRKMVTMSAPMAPMTCPSVSIQPEAKVTETGLPEKKIIVIRDPFLKSMEETNKFFTARARVFIGVALTGILWDGEAPSAIINGRVYKIGDAIEGKKITQITKDKVILESQGVEYLLLIWNDK